MSLTLGRSQNDIDMPIDLINTLTTGENLNDALSFFLNLNDHAIWNYIPVWKYHDDEILQDMCTRLINRNLFKSARDSDIDDRYKNQILGGDHNV